MAASIRGELLSVGDWIRVGKNAVQITDICSAEEDNWPGLHGRAIYISYACGPISGNFLGSLDGEYPKARPPKE